MWISWCSVELCAVTSMLDAQVGNVVIADKIAGSSTFCSSSMFSIVYSSSINSSLNTTELVAEKSPHQHIVLVAEVVFMCLG